MFQNQPRADTVLFCQVGRTHDTLPTRRPAYDQAQLAAQNACQLWYCPAHNLIVLWVTLALHMPSST